MVTIKAKPTTYFYSDSIYLTTGKTLTTSEKAMSLTELQDTLEAFSAKHLEISDEDVAKIRAEYLNRKAGGGNSSGGGGSGGVDPSTLAEIDRLSSELRNIERISIPDFTSIFRRNLQ